MFLEGIGNWPLASTYFKASSTQILAFPCIIPIKIISKILYLLLGKLIENRLLASSIVSIVFKDRLLYYTLLKNLGGRVLIVAPSRGLFHSNKMALQSYSITGLQNLLCKPAPAAGPASLFRRTLLQTSMSIFRS